jgi:hypothetical protein
MEPGPAHTWIYASQYTHSLPGSTILCCADPTTPHPHALPHFRLPHPSWLYTGASHGARQGGSHPQSLLRRDVSWA